MKFAATRCFESRTSTGSAISFPEAAIPLVSDRDRDLWDNPFADNRILVVVPTAQARTNKSNKKQETKIFMSDSVFFRQIRTYGITKSRAAWCVKAFVYGTIFPRRFKISVILVTDRNRSDFGTCGFELVKAYLYGKNSDEYSVAFRSFAKEGGHPKRYEEMVGLCEFWGFITIVTTISNNTRLTYTRRMLPMKELFSNRKREEAVVDEAHFSWTV